MYPSPMSHNTPSAHFPISHDLEPIRLFKSDFLEFFTHISPVTIVAIWLPVVLFLLGRASIATVGSAVSMYPSPMYPSPMYPSPMYPSPFTAVFPWHIPAGLLVGLFLWTLSEYLLHRFVFHYRPRGAWQERVVFLFHGIHHAQPQCKTRLVMPPVVSLPLAAVFYGFFWFTTGKLLGLPEWIDPLASGFLIGYLIYDLTHYATHHFPMRSGVLKFLKRYHMQHHYKTPEKRFGVSSPLWDWVFGTISK